MASKPDMTNRDLTKDPDSVFEALWEEHNIPVVRKPEGSTKGVTVTYNQGKFLERLEADRAALDARAAELEAAGLEDQAAALREAPVYEGMARHAIMRAVAADDGEKVDKATLDEMRKHNVIDSNVAERSTPLVFDPEILQSLKDDAPLLWERTARQGQQGYYAVFNRVDRRQRPIGRVPEAVSKRLQDLARDFGLNREDVPMKIYADTAEIGDFAATASAHYMDLEDLGIGARMSEYALFDEQEGLYGRYEQDDVEFVDGEEFDYVEGEGEAEPLEGGSPVGEYAARGLAEWFRLADEAAAELDRHDTDHYVDKSDVSEDIAKDIKREITDLTQGPYATRIQDLEIWTSATMENFLEDEFVGRARHQTNDSTLRFGGEQLYIKQDVEVVPSHNVDEHTYVAQDEDDDWQEYDEEDGDFAEQSVGSVGDVFIVNTATFQKRELSPLSSFPLAVRGGADEVAMLAYDANVELSGGFFGKFLKGYDIPEMTAE